MEADTISKHGRSSKSHTSRRNVLSKLLTTAFVIGVVACCISCDKLGTAPAITTASLPDGTVGTAYSQTLAATGDATITWSLESGSLPTGLTLLGSGTISGTPTTAGTSNFTVKATNAAGNDTKQLSITITGGINLSLNGVWKDDGGTRITVSGSTGALSQMSTIDPFTQDAINKGYIQLGGQTWRNLTSTGNLTWSGQNLKVFYENSTPNVADGKAWCNCTITMSADGQTITLVYQWSYKGSSGTNTETWTRGNYSLDGVWESSAGMQITVSGSTGVFNAFGTLNTLWTDAKNKNYITLGGQFWRNITSTGNLTWSGQEIMVMYNTSNPNVAVSTQWYNHTFTMSAVGQTLSVKWDNEETVVTWTRKQ